MNKKKLPIGISDFRKVIEEDFYYVDKSLFIKEIIDTSSESILLPRPRRFGKTLNLSMLRYFYEKTDEDTGRLFRHLDIRRQGEAYIRKQGRHPVIFLTFKDVKCGNWDECEKLLKRVIRDEYRRHNYLLEQGFVKSPEKEEFQSILDLSADITAYENSLKQLSAWLHHFQGEKTVILIDEYDTPIQAGYMDGYYISIIGFMRNMLSGAFKDNSHLEKGVLTGILRIAKESIFSGLNNLEVCSLLSPKYSQSFGLLDREVEQMLQDYEAGFVMEEIKAWYNG